MFAPRAQFSVSAPLNRPGLNIKKNLAFYSDKSPKRQITLIRTCRRLTTASGTDENDDEDDDEDDDGADAKKLAKGENCFDTGQLRHFTRHI